MGHIKHTFGGIVDPVIHADLTARGAKAGLTGEGDAMPILTAGTYPACITTIRVTAEHHALNDVSYVSLLIKGDLIGQVEVAVAIPVAEEYLTKAVVPG